MEKGARKEALAHARELISGGMAELLSRRKKLIKLADRSEAGWAFVEEYIEDDLADNLDDERRIEKAEKAAERKLAKRKRERDAGMKRGIAQPTAGRMDTQLPDGKRLQRWGKEHSSLVPFSRAAPGACHLVWRVRPLEAGMPKTGTHSSSNVSFIIR